MMTGLTRLLGVLLLLLLKDDRCDCLTGGSGSGLLAEITPNPTHICVVNNPCLNGGTCVMGTSNDVYACMCPVGFDDGTNCSKADQSCKQWIDKENENEKTWYADLPPCPCVIQQAQQDWRYRFFSWGVSENCAVFVAGGFLATTECCYNVSTGALLVDPPSAGGYRRYSPIFSSSVYTEDTVKPHQYCCESGSNMCDAYYNLRPIDDCSGYQPVRRGLTWGDPHFESVDGRRFTYNGVGEHTLLQSSIQNHELIIQARLSPLNGTNAAVLTAVVMKNGDSLRVQIEANTLNSVGERLSLFINETEYPIPSDTLIVTESAVYEAELDNSGSNTVNAITVANNNGSLLLITPSRAILRISVTSVSDSIFLYSSLMLGDSSFLSSTRGLLGIYNNNPSDDFTSPSGTVFTCINMTANECADQFGHSWKLNNISDSHFYYREENGFDKYTYSDLNYDPIHDVEMNSSAHPDLAATCGDDYSCWYDGIVTDSSAFGTSSRMVNQTFIQMKDDLENFPPKITGLFRLVVNANTKRKVNYTVTDEKDGNENVTLSLNNEAAGADGIELDPSVGELNVNLSSLPTVPIYLIAEDSSGRTTQRRVSILLCDCPQGLDTCPEPDLDKPLPTDPITGHYKLPCTCLDNFSGVYCERNSSGCSADFFPEFATCHNNSSTAENLSCSKCLGNATVDSDILCFVESSCNDTMRSIEIASPSQSAPVTSYLGQLQISTLNTSTQQLTTMATVTQPSSAMVTVPLTLLPTQTSTTTLTSSTPSTSPTPSTSTTILSTSTTTLSTSTTTLSTSTTTLSTSSTSSISTIPSTLPTTSKSLTASSSHTPSTPPTPSTSTISSTPTIPSTSPTPSTSIIPSVPTVKLKITFMAITINTTLLKITLINSLPQSDETVDVILEYSNTMTTNNLVVYAYYIDTITMMPINELLNDMVIGEVHSQLNDRFSKFLNLTLVMVPITETYSSSISPSPSPSLSPSPSSPSPMFPIWAFAVSGSVAAAVTIFAVVWLFIVCLNGLRKYHKKQKTKSQWEEDDQYTWINEQPDVGQEALEIREIAPNRRVSKKPDLFDEFTNPLTVDDLLRAISHEQITKLHSQFMGIPPNMITSSDLPSDADMKNRYKDVLPNPQTRVSLFLKFGVPYSDYINANYIRGYRKAAKEFVATQAPLPDTINDFWRMVWEQKSTVIVMLTNHEERGKTKCAHYWPGVHTGSWTAMYGEIEVTHINTVTNRSRYNVTNFRIRNPKYSVVRDVVHYWFTGWPEQGVPDTTAHFLKFILEVGKVTGKLDSMHTPQAPVVVHCSSGISRTGVFIGALNGMKELDEQRRIDILAIVSSMRQDRGGMVQTKDQYVFLHKVLYDYALSIGMVPNPHGTTAPVLNQIGYKRDMYGRPSGRPLIYSIP